MRFRILLVVACALGLQNAMGAGDGQYKFLSEIAIGGEGGWDYLSVDPGAHRLYVSHATKIVVVDLEKNAVAGEIADTPGIHGFAIASDLGRGFASNGKENKVSIVDLKTLATISKVETGENPDAVLYEPGRGEVYAFNGRGKSATVFDAKTGKVTATIPLPGKPEFAAADQKAGRVYCNIEDKSEIVAIDTSNHTVVATWPLAPGEEPSGMAFDVAHHRLFIGCNNKLMMVVDSGTGKIVASVPIGAGVDACAFDDKTQLAFASCGEGTTTIAKEETPEKFTVVQTLKTEPRARTMALDPATHRIYLASAKFQPAPSPSPGASPSRPTIVPNSMKVLVYGQE
ncbi:MAG: YVTN family beta-propeller domain-containing protein [Verrucomicrobia bacterium]|nr:MAG: YVTN family beta-propeller domain-containing protein [Verrucomicrobiota bacterium]